MPSSSASVESADERKERKVDGRNEMMEREICQRGMPGRMCQMKEVMNQKRTAGTVDLYKPPQCCVKS